MRIVFPSDEFDDAVAAVCHGQASGDQLDALGEILRRDAQARDAYLHRVALHAHLASEPDLFAGVGVGAGTLPDVDQVLEVPGSAWTKGTAGGWGAGWGWEKWALAAGVMVILGAIAWLGFGGGEKRRDETTRAVAMLNRVVNARWTEPEGAPRLGAPLEPRRLRLEAGLAQIVFYNGARVVIEGPTDLRLVTSAEVVCERGTVTVEVPSQARGFRVVGPRLEVTDLGTAFGIKVDEHRSELHVFEGRVEFRVGRDSGAQGLVEGEAVVIEGGGDVRLVAAEPGAFAGHFDLQAKSVAAEARRYDQWRGSARRLQSDPSLWVHLDFEHGGAPAWRLANSGSLGAEVPDATIVGCEWREGRWAMKPALEFRGISDRVRLHVPGDLESVTLAAWVRVQGLDRQINSIFMSDGFLPGTLHWLIRNDGVLGLTVIGGEGDHQILPSPPVMTIDQFGIWTHLAVVLDAGAQEVTHYVNGQAVSRHVLRIAPPFRIGTAELGNWNPDGFLGNDPFLIRNFSGAMDEFCLFNRALTPDELDSLHAEGRPQAETLAAPKEGIRPSQPRSIPRNVP